MTMTATVTHRRPRPDRNVAGVRGPASPYALRAEWIKFWTVRSTLWSTAMLFVLGAGLTVADLRATPSGWPAARPTSRRARSSPGA